MQWRTWMVTATVLALAVACGSSGSVTSDDRSDGPPVAHDIAGEVGLDEITRTYGALVFDYDGDGDDDVLLGRHSSPAQLYEANDGSYDLVGDVEFPKVDRHGCATADVDDDGRPDVFCALGGNDGEKLRDRPHELWMQEDDGTFVDRAEAPLDDLSGRGRQAVFLDVDGDQDDDLYVGSAHPRKDGLASTNRLFVNEGDGEWRSAPELGLDEPWGIGSSGPGPPRGCLVTLDADDDGWTDVLLCARDPSTPANGGQVLRPRLMRNDGGRGFVDVTAQAGLPDEMLDAEPVDIDDDGDTDLVSVDHDGVRVHAQEDGRFVLVHERPVFAAFRVAVADVDGDGNLDIYVVRRRAAQPYGLPPDQRNAFLAHVEAGRDLNDVLLLNDGDIDDLREVRVPLPDDERANADDALPLDHDGDGQVELLVLNGASDDPGPLQVIDYG